MTLAQLAANLGWTLEILADHNYATVYVHTGELIGYYNYRDDIYRLSDYVVASRMGPAIWFKDRCTNRPIGDPGNGHRCTVCH